MKSILKKDRILLFVALLGLLASLVPLAARTKAEQSNRYYDYILDYSSLRYMASQSTQSEGEWLDRFASLGIDKATVAEATALGLSGSAGIPIHAMTVKTATSVFGWESDLQTRRPGVRIPHGVPKSHTNLDILSETLRVPRGVAFCISKISPFFQWIFSEFPTV